MRQLITGTRTFGYRSSDLQLETEDIDGSSGGLYTKLITRKYETSGSGTIAGRPAGFMIGDSSDPDADYDLTYAYDAAGRLEKISGTGLPAGGVKYARLANSELIEKIEYLDGGASPLLATTRSFETDRN
ncbi:MAG: hypothetical protein GXW96_03045, partial [Christensenellaceae bacterium]|nr:hypothetical protein [Christensenellaceae bacterium]